MNQLTEGMNELATAKALRAASNWREKTWNVIVGCSRVSAGCDNCYAIGECKRMSGNPKITQKHGVNPYSQLVQIRNGKLDFSGNLHFFEDRLDTPLRVKKPTIWFVNSLSDMYHREVSLDTLKRIFDVMNRADWHIFDILTKRADRMIELSNEVTWTTNIWQGITFEGIPEFMPEGQRNAVRSRIPALQQHPARVKFISFEPLIGPISPEVDLTGVDWAFFGGESHQELAKARPMDLNWLRDGIALCKKYGCKPHIKQLGTSWAVSSRSWPPPRKAWNLKFHYRDGKPLPKPLTSNWPEDLQPYAIESLRQVTPEDLRA